MIRLQEFIIHTVAFILVLLWVGMITFPVWGFDYGEYVRTDPYGWLLWGWDTDPVDGEAATDLGQILREEAWWPSSMIARLLDEFGIDFSSAGDGAFSFIRNLINYALSIVGLIATVILIFAFYKMFFWDGEEALTDARKLFINTAIALFIIGMARVITAFLFSLVGTAAS